MIVSKEIPIFFQNSKIIVLTKNIINNIKYNIRFLFKIKQANRGRI